MGGKPSIPSYISNPLRSSSWPSDNGFCFKRDQTSCGSRVCRFQDLELLDLETIPLTCLLRPNTVCSSFVYCVFPPSPQLSASNIGLEWLLHVGRSSSFRSKSRICKRRVPRINSCEACVRYLNVTRLHFLALWLQTSVSDQLNRTVECDERDLLMIWK